MKRIFIVIMFMFLCSTANSADIAVYHFSEADGSTSPVDSASRYSALCYDHAHVESDQGKWNNSMQFDGTNDFFRLTNGAGASCGTTLCEQFNFADTAITPIAFSFWWRPGSNNNTIVHRQDDAGGAYWRVYASGGTCAYGDSAGNACSAGCTQSANTWYFMYLVKEGGTLALYNSGTFICRDSSLSDVVINDGTINLGLSASWYSQAGYLDDLVMTDNDWIGVTVSSDDGFTPPTTEYGTAPETDRRVIFVNGEEYLFQKRFVPIDRQDYAKGFRRHRTWKNPINSLVIKEIID